MILAVRGGVQVVRNADLLEQVNETFVIGLVDFLDRLAKFVCAHGDGRAVRVGASDHQHLISLETMIACGNIPGQVGACQVSDVDFSIGIGPGNCN